MFKQVVYKENYEHKNLPFLDKGALSPFSMSAPDSSGASFFLCYHRPSLDGALLASHSCAPVTLLTIVQGAPRLVGSTFGSLIIIVLCVVFFIVGCSYKLIARGFSHGNRNTTSIGFSQIKKLLY